jgi:DNA invertase Pin-like site-specific DNA recombinase
LKFYIEWRDVCATIIMNIGYARVSKIDEQTTTAQENALKAAGCQQIFHEAMSGGSHKPKLQEAISHLREGDVLVVWKLDRLSRSLKDMLFSLEKITAAKAGFRSLTENVDTTTPAGRMLASMLGAFAEFEKSMVRERTLMGLAEARAQGRKGGRRYILSEHQRKEAVRMVVAGEKTQSQIARMHRVNRSVVSRLVSEARVLEVA